MLFGFPDRRSKVSGPDYPPLAGGNHGGSIVIETAQLGTVTLQRYKSGKRQRLELRLNDGSLGSEEDLAKLLGGISAKVYQSIYAFSLTELQSFESLEDEKVKDVLYGASVGAGLYDLPAIRQQLLSKSKNLYAPRGQKPEINQLLKQLDKIKGELKECETYFEQYRSAKDKALILQDQLDHLSKELEKKEKIRRQLAVAVQAWDAYLDKKSLEHQLGSLRLVVETFPSDGLARMESLLKRIEEVKAHLAELTEEHNILNKRKAHLSHSIEEDLLKKEPVLKRLVERVGRWSDAEKGLGLLLSKKENFQKGLNQILSFLGLDWNKEKLLSFNPSLAVKTEIDKWIKAINQAELDIEHSKALVKEKIKQHEHAQNRLNNLRAKLEKFDNIRPLADSKVFDALYTQYGLFQTNLSRLNRVSNKLAQLKDAKIELSEKIKKMKGALPFGITKRKDLLALNQDIRAAGFLTQSLEKLLRDEDHLVGLKSEKEFQQALLEEKLQYNPLGIWKWVLPAIGLAMAEMLAFYFLLARDEPLLGAIIFISALAAALAYWKRENTKEAWLQEQNRHIEARIDNLQKELLGIERRLLKNRDEQAKLRKELKKICKRAGLPERPKEHDLLNKHQQLDKASVLFDKLETLLTELDHLKRNEEELQKEVEGLSSLIEEYAGLASEVLGIKDKRSKNYQEIADNLSDFFKKYKETETLLQKKHSLLQALEEAEKEASQIEQFVSKARTRFEASLAKMEQMKEQWAGWLEQKGLDKQLTPFVAKDAIQKIEQAHSLAGEIEQSEQDIKHNLEIIKEFKEDAHELFDSMGLKVNSDAEIGAAIQELNKRLKESIEAKIQIRGIQEQLAQTVKKIKGEKARLNSLEEELSELLAQAKASDLEEFRNRYSWFVKRADLLEKLEKAEAKLELLDLEISLEEFFKKYGDKKLLIEKLQSLEREIAALKVKQKELYEEQAHIDHLINDLSTFEKMEQLKLDQEILKQKLKDKIFRWSSYTMALHLLDEAKHRFELKKQPKILQDAGRFFSIITNGQYEKIIPSSQNSSFDVIDKYGKRKSADQLSRGTAEQLYLALRFGYILNYGLKDEPLPIIMDDILVNFDPVRAKNTIKTIKELTNSHQVLFFTCHPQTVSNFKDIMPEAQQFIIEKGQIKPQ